MNTSVNVAYASPQQNNRSYKMVVYFICLIGALGGLLFGLDQGFIANSLETIKGVYHLDTHGAESYSAILATGGVIGALLSGLFARFLGRKRSLVFAGLIFTIASLISSLLPSFAVLSTSRFFLGFGVGVASFITPLYLSETAPAAIRGAMGTLFQLMITIGIFLIAATNVYIAKIFVDPGIALPLMFLVIALFAVLMLVGSLFLPESPRWLMLKGRKEQARAVVRRVSNSEQEVDLEIREIEQVLSEDKGKLSDIFKKHFFKILVLGVVLQMFQQLVGINVMIYYAPTIFGYAGMKGLLAMMLVPTVNMLFTFPAISLVEKWGRKKLLCVGAIIMCISMIAAGLAFAHIGNMAADTIGSVPKTVLLIAVVVYIFGFAFSWGPVAWLVCSEIFPLKGREIGMTITTMVNWTFAGIMMAYALTFMETYGKAPLFYVLAGFCVLAVLFVLRFIPETKGITLEELEERLKHK
jgi:SP family galactose:H+ symporter-like MFS transporter